MMKHTRDGVECFEMEEQDAEPPPPHLRLALAVVKSALDDVKVGAKARRRWQDDHQYFMIVNSSEDAKDFLLRRLNEDDNHWGQILRLYGMRPLTEARLSRLMRTGFTITGRGQ